MYQPRAKLGLSASARFYQRYRGVDVFAEKGEGEGGFGEGTWLVSRHLQAPPCEIDAITAICFHIFAPAI